MNIEKSKKIKKDLKKFSVGIAGAGGLGSNAAISLARVGIGRIVIVDFDIIEESNLNRQYYFQDQIGTIKVEALKQNIQRINPEIIVETVNKKLIKGSMDKYFHDVDVIIEALDNAETKTSFIEEIMMKLSDIPVVAASGVAGYGFSDRIKTIRLGNLYMCYDEKAKSSDEDILTAPKVCLMANWEANIVLEILLGENK
jgi:sulfur carrier protein ThiS adenylyltransferase